jgi:hypothetical protein
MWAFVLLFACGLSRSFSQTGVRAAFRIQTGEASPRPAAGRRRSLRERSLHERSLRERFLHERSLRERFLRERFFSFF